MPIFTDNVRQVEAPSNSQLTLALADALGKNNVGKALGDTFRDFAGLTHDYTYGTSMGIANDIKKARDLLGAAKDENGLFLNSNDKIQELLRAQNPNWTANNYADANMEAWLKDRESEGRALEKLKLDKEEGGRSQQRLNLQIQQANAQMRKDRLLEQAMGLKAGFLEAQAEGMGRAYIDKMRSAIEANPYAKADIFGIAGNDLVDFSADDATISKNLSLVDPITIRDQLRDIEDKKRALANTEGMSLLINPDGSVRHKSSNEVFEEMAKGREYTGKDYSKFRENWNEEYARLKGLYPDLDDVTLGAILENTVGTRGIFSGNIPLINNRVDDWNIYWNHKSTDAAKSANMALKYLSDYKNLDEHETKLKAYLENESARKITSELTNKIKAIEAAGRAGRYTPAEVKLAKDRARAEAAASVAPITQLIDRALADGKGIPNTLKKPE